VKDVDGLIINDIMEDFQRPTAGIKAEQQVFILITADVNLVFINPVFDSVANAGFADTAFKGRPVYNELRKCNFIQRYENGN
jgi:hypothetical protein